MRTYAWSGIIGGAQEAGSYSRAAETYCSALRRIGCRLLPICRVTFHDRGQRRRRRPASFERLLPFPDSLFVDDGGVGNRLGELALIAAEWPERPLVASEASKRISSTGGDGGRLGQVANKTDSVVAWLMEGDPAIRWQVRRDVLGQTSSQVATERARVAREGWGSQLLNLQTATGVWAGLYTPKWTSATYTLLLLKALGLPAGNRAAGLSATILLDKGLYHDEGINFWTPRRRCSETCVTGMILGIASRFVRGDDRLNRLAKHLLSEQMPDGGWNCRRHPWCDA